MDTTPNGTEGSFFDVGSHEPGSYEPPQGDIECAIARLWQELFRLHKVGRNENFFELGGDSLAAMKLTEAFATRLELQLPVVAVFLNPTVRELAKLIAPVPQS